MEQLLNKIEVYKNEINAFSVSDTTTVEEFRIKWLGTKGIVKEIMGEMKMWRLIKRKKPGNC